MFMSCPTQRWRVPPLVVLACTVLGCAEEPPPPAEAVRTIKTITVAEPASGRVRRFSGVVEAADSSSIGFEVGGIVEEIKVDVGDQIEKGQVLAVMDKSTYELNVEAAQASVRRAEAEFREAQSNLEREQRMAQEDIGATSQRALDQAEAARDTTRQNLSYATSRLNLARRDLERTVLYSPFDGTIATRHVDAFKQVQRGQPIFDLFMEGAMEAAVSIPESEIKQVHLGLPGEVRFPAIPGETFNAIVTEKSRVAGAANAFPVRLTVDGEDPRIRPGVTAEVTLLLGVEASDSAYLIPLGALAPRTDDAGSYVFKFDADTSTVRKTPIEYGGVRASDVVVEAGLNAGDIIAVAGVSFLYDGQKVRPMR